MNGSAGYQMRGNGNADINASSWLKLPIFSLDKADDYPNSQDYQDGDEINGGRLAKPNDFPW